MSRHNPRNMLNVSDLVEPIYDQDRGIGEGGKSMCDRGLQKWPGYGKANSQKDRTKQRDEARKAKAASCRYS